MNDADRQTLNLVHNVEQLGEATAGLAGVVGRYYDGLPEGMPEELKQHLTLDFARQLHDSVLGNPVLQVLDSLKGLGE